MRPTALELYNYCAERGACGDGLCFIVSVAMDENPCKTETEALQLTSAMDVLLAAGEYRDSLKPLGYLRWLRLKMVDDLYHGEVVALDVSGRKLALLEEKMFRAQNAITGAIQEPALLRGHQRKAAAILAKRLVVLLRLFVMHQQSLRDPEMLRKISEVRDEIPF